MNTIFIVLPILTILMFTLGLELNTKEFVSFLKRPKPVIIGLIGQIIVLPVLAIYLGLFFKLSPLFFIGFVLIACSPGGSSSNVFSMLAKGDVALSVTLTTLSSLITLFTIPIIMSIALTFIDYNNLTIKLPVGKLIIQNIVLMLVPILLGIIFKKKAREKAERVEQFLKKISFPALLLLVSIFFIQHHETIVEQIGVLAPATISLILLAIFSGFLLAKLAKLLEKERRTIIIEIGMQNAAQSIAIASSPFIFNNDIIAIPSIIYALIMNIVLLTYIGRFLIPNTKKIT